MGNEQATQAPAKNVRVAYTTYSDQRSTEESKMREAKRAYAKHGNNINIIFVEHSLSVTECSKRIEQARHAEHDNHLIHEKSQGLPYGWKVVPSVSRPGDFSYQNEFTGEKITWKPKIVASSTSCGGFAGLQQKYAAPGYNSSTYTQTFVQHQHHTHRR